MRFFSDNLLVKIAYKEFENTETYSQILVAGEKGLNLYVDRLNLISELNIYELNKSDKLIFDQTDDEHISLLELIPSIVDLRVLDPVQMHSFALQINYGEDNVRNYYIACFDERIVPATCIVDDHEFTYDILCSVHADENGNLCFSNGYIIPRHILYHRSFRQAQPNYTGTLVYDNNGIRIRSLYKLPLTECKDHFLVRQYWGHPDECFGPKKAWMDDNGQRISDITISTEEANYENGIMLISVEPTYKYGFIKDDGTWLVPPIYNQAEKPFDFPVDVESFTNNRCAFNVEKWTGESPDAGYYWDYDGVTPGKWGFIDSEGNIIVEPKYVFAVGFYNGGGEHSVVARYVDGKLCWGVIDLNGSEVIPCKYPGLYCRWGEAVAFQTEKNGPYGVMDFTGEVIVEPQFNYVEEYDPKHRLVTVGEDEEHLGVYSVELGKMLIPTEYDCVDYYERMISCEPTWTCNERYFDYSGNELDFPEYDRVCEERELLIIWKDGKCGLIDGNKNVIIPEVYSEIYLNGDFVIASNRANGNWCLNDSLFTIDGELIMSGTLRNMHIDFKKKRMSVETPTGVEVFELELELEEQYVMSQNVQAKKLMDALAGLQLTSGELEIAEKYLKGEAGEESLAGLTFRDMETLPEDKMQELVTLFETCFEKGRYEEAARFFHLVYAVGNSTCHVCFPYTEELRRKMKDGTLQLNRSKVLAVLARKRAADRYPYSNNLYIFTDNLATMAQSNPQIVLQAYRECKAPQSNGRILLLTLYFYLCYGKSELNEGEKLRKKKEAQQGTSHTGSSYALGLGGVLMNDGDRALLAEYEAMLVESLGMLFVPDASGEQQICEIQKQIRQGTLTKDQLAGIRSRTANKRMFRQLGGCAYINYMLSEQVRSVVMVCGAVDPQEMLLAIEWMDLRGEIGHVAGELEELFCIPNRESISWAADQLTRHEYRAGAPEELLCVQFRRHREDFLEIYKNVGYRETNAMAEIILKEDPALYEQEVLNKGDMLRDKLIDLMTDGLSCANEVKDYLTGRADLSTLHPFKDQHSDWHRQGGLDAIGALIQYDEIYHNEDFFGRCMAYMALMEKRYFFIGGSLFHDEDLNQKKLEHIFRGLDHAGIDVAGQLRVIMLMLDDTFIEEKKQDIINGCIPIFQQYLAEYTQEAVKAFSEAGIYGRCFALRVYSGKAKIQITEGNRESCMAAREEFAKGKDAWKEQILSYSKDSSMQVRQELEKLLTDRPGWREEVKELLSSKKAAERELGIRVLANWNTPQDREALQELYGSEKSAKIRELLDTVLGQETESADTEEGAAGEDKPDLTRKDGKISFRKYLQSRR